jgi:hypothetical protein
MYLSKNAKTLQKVQQSGLRGIKSDVFAVICNTPGLTVGEIATRYSDLKPERSRPRNEIAKRVLDLVYMGLVKKVGVTECPVTHRKAARWFPTGGTDVVPLKRNNNDSTQNYAHVEGTVVPTSSTTTVVTPNETVTVVNVADPEITSISPEVIEGIAYARRAENRAVNFVMFLLLFFGFLMPKSLRTGLKMLAARHES